MLRSAGEKYSSRLFSEISSWFKKVNYIYIENVKRNGNFDLDEKTIDELKKISGKNFTPPKPIYQNGVKTILLAKFDAEVYLDDFEIPENKIRNNEVYQKIFKDKKLKDTLGIYVFQKDISSDFDGVFLQKYHAILIGMDNVEEMKKNIVHELTHYNDYITSILQIQKYEKNDLYDNSSSVVHKPNKNKVIDPIQKYEYEFWAWYNSFLYDIKKILKNEHKKHKNLSRIIFNEIFNKNSISQLKELKSTSSYNNEELDNIINILNGKINSTLGKKISDEIEMVRGEVISSGIKNKVLKEIKFYELQLKKIESKDGFEEEIENRIEKLKEYLLVLKRNLSYTYFLKKLIKDLIKDNLLPSNTNFQEYKK